MQRYSNLFHTEEVAVAQVAADIKLSGVTVALLPSEVVALLGHFGTPDPKIGFKMPNAHYLTTAPDTWKIVFAWIPKGENVSIRTTNATIISFPDEHQLYKFEVIPTSNSTYAGEVNISPYRAPISYVLQPQ